ncbi:gluconate 2-dehydrogenase subunit 3 family protein [Halorussus litoreus]|uniref:gluconate 2-dehydrogenase subunit 3 family protein n=1 Tax=Halorussus litoreus TaxID=1710536 RepID=UPI000E27629B|nr:gluconate 2-dehydrogenase subunit 3 family protein [Halorussus litoreus]
MELSRRDALAALAASSVAVGGGAVLTTDVEEGALDGTPFGGGASSGDDERASGDGEADPLAEDRLATLLAVADVVYPSGVSGVEEFVRTYALGRTADRPEHREGMVDALAALDEHARSWHDAAFRDLDAETRESVLDQMAVDATNPDPEGADPERVRFYVVNELLYALYTSPTGGELVGLENPQGHPGGADSYRRGPRE